MTEFILGIGHINREDCKQVLTDVQNRIKMLKISAKGINIELDHLKTIEFQVQQRLREIWEESEKKNVRK